MTRSKRMKPVVDVTANREREAARRLGELQNRERAAADRLDELMRYRDDYTRQFEGSGSLTVARLQDFRAFLSRLNQAVETQRQVLERARLECAAQHARWLDARNRAQALDNVTARYRHAERDEQERREQKDADQRAQQGRGSDED